MNYFSHYFFFKDQSNPYKSAGMLLPDLARFSEGKKPLHTANPEEYSDLDFKELYEGCQIHYKADVIFHKSTFFEEMMNGVSAILLENNFDYGTMRKWFFNHIFVEMIFDRVLIKKYPEILNEFYSDLKNTEAKKIAKFLSSFGRTGLENFEYFYNRFVSSEFLKEYTNDQGFIASLNRTMQKVSQPPVSQNQLPDLMPQLETFVAPYENKLSEEFFIGFKN